MAGLQDDFSDDQSVVQQVNNLIESAVQQNASDIHLEPRLDNLRVRLRLDGLLKDYGVIDKRIMQQVISHIKVVAHIDIAEKRIPQDGKFSARIIGRPIDFRVATYPTPFGEKVVIRILDRATHMIELDGLGLAPQVFVEFKELIERPHGFFLVTGPTGSGKTTTLYSVLSVLNSAEKNILSLEDPIEYHLDGITQGQVNPEAGFGFENGMRALLRQDPDILMVGEIRDKQSAQIAIEAALTGHVVFSTLHTNDAASAYTRLMEMGIEPFLINTALTGVLAQRLIRTLCQECIATKKTKSSNHRCAVCDGSGYKGRIGIFELLKTSSTLRELINKQPKYEDIYAQAMKDGMQTLAQDGAQKVAAGVSSAEEVARVIGVL